MRKLFDADFTVCEFDKGGNVIATYATANHLDVARAAYEACLKAYPTSNVTLRYRTQRLAERKAPPIARVEPQPERPAEPSPG